MRPGAPPARQGRLPGLYQPPFFLGRPYQGVPQNSKPATSATQNFAKPQLICCHIGHIFPYKPVYARICPIRQEIGLTMSSISRWSACVRAHPPRRNPSLGNWLKRPGLAVIRLKGPLKYYWQSYAKVRRARRRARALSRSPVQPPKTGACPRV